MINLDEIKQQTDFLNSLDKDCPVCKGKVQNIFDLEIPTCSICGGYGKIPNEKNSKNL